METLITIPYEATDVRSAAKALGARWRPATKQWALPTEEAAAEIRATIAAFEGASPITVRRMHESYGTSYSRGDVMREEGAWVFVERTEREFCDPDEGDCNSMYSKGFHWTLHCRPATDAESAEKASRFSKEEMRRESRAIALAAADALEKEAENRDAPLREYSRESERIYEVQVSGFYQFWAIEAEGTEDRAVLRVDDRDWHDGPSRGMALPWTAEREAVIRAAGEHWNRR